MLLSGFSTFPIRPATSFPLLLGQADAIVVKANFRPFFGFLGGLLGLAAGMFGQIPFSHRFVHGCFRSGLYSLPLLEGLLGPSSGFLSWAKAA